MGDRNIRKEEKKPKKTALKTPVNSTMGQVGGQPELIKKGKKPR